MKHTLKFCCLIVFAISLFSTAAARDFALVIGINEYFDSRANLRGPVKDADLIVDLLENQLDYKGVNTDIVVLTNQSATKDAIISEFEEIIREAQPGDRVFIYYSGHGHQVTDTSNDEPDGCDEALLVADGKSITDDEIDSLLSRIQSDEILMIVDSCFSGTITKSIPSPGQPKTKNYSSFDADLRCNVAANKQGAKYGVGAQSRGIAGEFASSNAQNNVIGLTATAHNQVAYDALRSNEGSVFTQVLYNQLATTSKSISFSTVQAETAAVVRDTLIAHNLEPHTPQIFGNEEWRDRDFFQFGNLTTTPDLAPVTELSDIAGSVVIDEFFTKLLNGQNNQVVVRTDLSDYRLEQDIKIDVYSALGGYIHLFERDADGRLALVYPNRYNSRNDISGDITIRLPSMEYGNFNFYAVEPYGVNRLIAVVTQENLNLYEEAVGTSIGPFKVYSSTDSQYIQQRLSAAATKGVGARGTYGAGEYYYRINR